MTHWHNIIDIANAFDFSPSATLDEARAELLKRLAKIHPDQNSGSFLNADTEAQYYKTLSAIQKIDELKLKGSNLVPYAEKPVAAWKAVQANERTEEASLRRDIANVARSKLRTRKIKSGVFAVAITGAMAFSAKFSENPIVVNLFTYTDIHFPWFRPLMDVAFVLLIIAVWVAFLSSWQRENQEKIISEEILTEQKILDLFKSHGIKSKISGNGVFSFTDLVNAILNSGDYRRSGWVEWVPPLLSKKLPVGWRYRTTRNLFFDNAGLAYQAAELIINKLESRGAITALDEGSLTRQFQLSEAAQKQIEK